MNILVSLSYYMPNISGITLYAECLVRKLAQKGHDISVITSQHLPHLPVYEEDKNSKIYRVPVTFRIGKGVIMLSFPWRIFKLMKQVDVVNCHLPQFESAIVAILAKIMGKKVVLTHHCDLSWEGVGPQVVVAGVYLSQIIAGILADTIIVYTRDYADHSWFLRLFKKKLVQLYPPIDTPVISKTPLRKDTGKIHIGFVGRIVHEKGLPYLLNAIPYLQKTIGKPFKLFLIGPTTEVIGENYLSHIQVLLTKYQKYITVTGKVPHANLGDFYKDLDVLVLPSTDSLEAFGIVQVEAMLMGTPVVATDLPGVRIPIQTTGMGIVIPLKNSSAIAEAIEKIIAHKKLYVKPKELVRNIFDIDKTIGRYEDIFRN